ncbi:hypothetical protein [Streptomyces werraensis]|uniref:hypothetical protein n=1 Tax=Streptomyces werraensis TaxID=68284 RepID=UPI0036A76449
MRSLARVTATAAATAPFMLRSSATAASAPGRADTTSAAARAADSVTLPLREAISTLDVAVEDLTGYDRNREF